MQKELAEGFQIEEVDQTSIKEIMTPVVYAVLPEAPVTEVINQMVGLKVHRLFVVDADGVLIGVISTMDVLRHLRVANGSAPAPAKLDRKSTRLNSSHRCISYAVFCLKKKKLM